VYFVTALCTLPSVAGLCGTTGPENQDAVIAADRSDKVDLDYSINRLL